MKKRSHKPHSAATALRALQAILAATRSGKLKWTKADPERYETDGEPQVTIEFNYPQVGGETTTGADIAVVSFGGLTYSFFSGTEGMTKVAAILRQAFPEWEEHLKGLETKLGQFIQTLNTKKRQTP